MDLTPFPRMCGWVGHVTGNRPVGCAQKAAWLPAAPGGGRPTAVPCPLLLGGALLSHPMRELWRRCARGGERAWRGRGVSRTCWAWTGPHPNSPAASHVLVSCPSQVDQVHTEACGPNILFTCIIQEYIVPVNNFKIMAKV